MIAAGVDERHLYQDKAPGARDDRPGLMACLDYPKPGDGLGSVAITSGVIDMLVGAQGSAKGVIRLQHVLVWVAEGASWRLRLRQATRLPG